MLVCIEVCLHQIKKNHSLARKFRANCSNMSQISGLAYIETKNHNTPITLYKEWLEEAKHFGIALPLMNLATATRDGRVSNRTLVIRDVLDDGALVFTTSKDGNKVKDVSENPQVAATILLQYMKNENKIARQIRIEGNVEKISTDQCRIYYEREPLYCKIRSWICNQGESIEWADLKKKHDDLLKEVIENKKDLPMPHNLVGYKIIAKKVDFYSAWDNFIADRVLYQKDDYQGVWKMNRIQA